MEAPIVTLTTDWGSRDFFAAKVKGRLFSSIPGVRIVDLSHEQKWDDVVTLMQMIRYGCLSFPKGTLHIVDVGCEPSKVEPPMQGEGGARFKPEPVVAMYQGQYLICSEQRPLSWALEEMPDSIVSLPLPEGLDSYTFLAYDLFCDVVRQLVDGVALESLGTATQGFRLIRPLVQPPDSSGINAAVTYIDSYGNAQLNVRYDDFETLRAGRRFTVDFDNRAGREPIRSVSMHYNDVRMGNLLLTVSHTGYLQLAMNGASIAQYLGIRATSPCRIRFYD